MSADPPVTGARRDLRLPAAVAVIGIGLAVLEFVLDSRQPGVFAVPILVLTFVIELVLLLSGRAAPRRDWAKVAAEDGLEYDGPRPLPAVTPLLAGVRGAAPVLSGRLHEDGPWVRIAPARGRLVAITDAPAAAVDPGAQAWLERHRLQPQAAIEDGLLVVAVAEDVRPRQLLDLARELHARL